MNESEQLDDVVSAVANSASVIAGAILVVGGFINSSGTFITSAMLQATIPWWLFALNSASTLGGFALMISGFWGIKNIYSRQLRNIKRELDAIGK